MFTEFAAFNVARLAMHNHKIQQPLAVVKTWRKKSLATAKLHRI
jgi:hypothetical protein